MCLHRDQFTCQRCGHQGRRDGRDLHADHVIAVTQGGSNTLDNMMTLCIPCHQVKSQAEAMAGRREVRAIRPRPRHPADTLT